ncbi:MAG: type II secretion system F family protein [Planctomycetaceae bacterium]
MQDANPQPSAATPGQPAPSLLYGLDVLSIEAPTRRQRRSFARLSQCLQSGETLEAALAHESRDIPAYFQRLLAAPVASEKLGLLTQRYIQHCQRDQDIFRQIVGSLIYPTILLAFTCGIIYFALSWAVLPFKEIFMDFGTELPWITVRLISLADAVTGSLWRLLLVLGIVVILAITAWYSLLLPGGAAGRRYAFNSIPAIGTVFRYGSLARFCDLLALFVEFAVPLPEALRLSGEGSRDSSLRSAGEQLARSAENGVPLADAAKKQPEFPPLAAHVFRWEHRQSAFAEGLEAAADVFAARTQLQSSLLRVVLEPVVFSFIAVTVGFLLIALFAPLIKLLNDLS